tara:strand:- start:63 stop:977 length:915 start_codon:yes stop_codon:yes gene_type:complete
MKVCVTGATGYLGNNLIKELINRDIKVLSIIRNKYKRYEYISDFLITDLCNKEKLLLKLKEFEPDVIVHCAAHIPKDTNKEEEFLSLQNNIIATKNLLSIMEEIGTKHLIFSSTISIYTGNKISLNSFPFNEKSIIDPEGFYGRDKLKAEQLCINWSLKEINRKCDILRFSGIHGGGRKDGVIYNFINKFLISETVFIPSPYSRYSILSINDAVQAILLLLLGREKFIKNQTFNIAGNEDIELIEIAKKIKELTKSKSIIELGDKKLEVRSMDIRKAKKKIGFNPLPLDNWIKKEILEIYKSNH